MNLQERKIAKQNGAAAALFKKWFGPARRETTPEKEKYPFSSKAEKSFFRNPTKMLDTELLMNMVFEHGKAGR